MFSRAYALLLDALAGLAPDTASRMGASLGTLAFHIGIRRRVVRDNLWRSLRLTGSHRRAVSRRCYQGLGATFIEVWGVHGDRAPARVLNPQWLAAIQARQQGAVFLSLHIGNWDAGGAAVAIGARKMAVYAKAQHDETMNQRLLVQRQASGIEVIFARHGGTAGAISVMRLLRRGGTLGLTADQLPPRDEGCEGYFLHVPTRLHTGPAVLARLSKSIIVPGISLRRRSGENVLIIGRPIEPGATDQETTQRCMDIMSAMIARYPEHYFWHHRRFKRPVQLPPRAHAPWQAGLSLWK